MYLHCNWFIGLDGEGVFSSRWYPACFLSEKYETPDEYLTVEQEETFEDYIISYGEFDR